MKILKTGLVAVLLAVGLLVPAAPASAEAVSAGACPDGYQGVIVIINSPETGERELFVCWKPIIWH